MSRVIPQLADKHGVAADDDNAMEKLKDGWMELLTPAPSRVANANAKLADAMSNLLIAPKHSRPEA